MIDGVDIDPIRYKAAKQLDNFKMPFPYYIHQRCA